MILSPGSYQYSQNETPGIIKCLCFKIDILILPSSLLHFLKRRMWELGDTIRHCVFLKLFFEFLHYRYLSDKRWDVFQGNSYILGVLNKSIVKIIFGIALWNKGVGRWLIQNIFVLRKISNLIYDGMHGARTEQNMNTTDILVLCSSV